LIPTRRIHIIDLVTTAGKTVVENFETLSDAEKREVLVRILEISKEIEYPATADDELVTAADEIFAEYDRRESGNDSSKTR